MENSIFPATNHAFIIISHYGFRNKLDKHIRTKHKPQLIQK